MADELLNKMSDIFFSDFKSKLEHYDVYIQFWYHDDFHKTDKFRIKYRLSPKDYSGFGIITYKNDEHELTWSINKNMLDKKFINLLEQYTPFISKYMEWQQMKNN